jgi:hypothetical protein
VYVVTGNGTFDVNTGGIDYGDTFIKLNSSGAVADYFTPFDQANMDTHNWDLGSSLAMLLPDQPGGIPHLMVGGGKNQSVYLISRDSMGHFNPSGDTQIVQSLVNIFPNGTPEPGNYSSPVYFNGTVYFGPVNDNVQAFAMTNGRLSTTPTSRTTKVFPYSGGTLAVSANGNSNGILWVLEKTSTSVNGGTTPGILHAYNPSNLGVELYNSTQVSSRDDIADPVKFTVPVVVNGKVFVASQNRLTVYGLLP